MAIDPYDPWDDPSTVPAPGVYDYRRTGAGYSFTPQSAQNVGLAGAAYPWMSPGVAAAMAQGGLGAAPEIADASLQASLQEQPVATMSKRRVRETRRQVRRAKYVINDDVSTLREYGNDQWSPATPGQQDWLKAYGVYGTGKGKEQDRARALEIADQLEAAAQNGDDRTLMRLGKQLRKLADGTANADSGGFGDFLLSPVVGAMEAAAPVARGIKAANEWGSEQVGNPEMPIPGTKTAVRNVAIAAQAPADLFNASIRDFAYDISQSPGTLGVGAENNSAGPGENLKNLLSQTYAYQAWANGKATGDGLLPSYDPKIDGKESAAAAAGKAARTLYPEIVIDDHAWTPGRQLADLVVDPDSTAYSILSGLVDGAIALKADPTNALLDTVASARAAPRLAATAEGADALKAAGALKGYRQQVNTTTARSWLLNEGMSVVRAFKGNTDPLVSWKAFPEIPLSVHKKLAALPTTAPDSAYVSELYKLLGTDIRQPLNTNRIVGGRFLLGSKSKMWATLPPNFIDLTDPDEALKGLEAAGRHINAPQATVENLQRMVINSAGTPAQNEAIARATMGMYEEAFVNAGMSRNWAKNATRLVQDRLADARTYDIDENGIAAHFPFVQVDGKGVPIPDPALVTEMRNSAFELPDARTAKRIVSGLGEFLNYDPGDLTALGRMDTSEAFKAMESSIDVMDKAMGVWKQLVLMRPAWGLRVIAEEQLRMAASGSASLFRSPLSAVAWVLGNPADADVAQRVKNVAAGTGAVIGGVYGAQQDGLEGAVLGAAAGGAGAYALAGMNAQKIQEAFSRAKIKYGRGISGIGGSSFYDPNSFDEYMQSQYGGFRNLEPSNAAKLRTHLFGSVYNTDAKAPQAYAEELVRVGSDPVVKAILTENDLAKVKDSFWNGDLAAHRQFLSEAPDRPGAVRQWREMKNDRLLSDQYIDYVAGRIERVTNRNPAFVDVMKTGIWNNTPIAYRFKNGGVVVNDDLLKDATWVDAVNQQAPNRIRAEHTLTRSDAEKKVSLSRVRGALDTLFDALMPRPSNYLSRSPEFRQKYWQRVEELFPEMGVKAREQVLKDAERANLGKDALARFETMHSAASPKVVLTAKKADTIAKRFALDETKNLLYDLSEKSQFFDATRLIFPFGEAWKEIITRWATLLAEHPNYIRRAQQGIQAARQMKVDEITGLPDPGGIGMFHKDLTTGEESFIYPMTGLISDKLIGVPIPLVGSVKGLNLIGSGLPGIGPVVQFPLAAILPDSPKYDTVRELLFPYGEPQGGSPTDIAAETLLPAWMKKINQAFSSPNMERLQGNVVAAVMQYKLSTGEYEVNGPNAQDEIKRLFTDSKKSATQFMVIRGLAQSLAPTAPTPQFLVKQGPNLVIATKIAQDYRKRAEKVGWDNAFEWLLETYGTDTALLIAQARSEAQIPGLNSKTDQLAWERRNPDLVTRYPDVWTMFAPNTGEFDIGAYSQEFDRDQRAGLTPIQIVKKANDRLARHIYNRQRDALEADGKMTAAEETQLKAFREQLLSDFPGYDPYTFQNKTPVYIAQLKDAISDPSLSRTPAGSAISKYFAAREAAEKEAAAKKVALFGTSAKGKQIRDRLFAFGDSLRLQVPDFGTAWNEVFVYEFKDR